MSSETEKNRWMFVGGGAVGEDFADPISLRVHNGKATYGFWGYGPDAWTRTFTKAKLKLLKAYHAELGDFIRAVEAILASGGVTGGHGEP